ncbi:type II secretion system protein [Bacillus sp. UNC438CL73TsuS30]|uniref:type II secretion system protein n=1 Tax=Bacillus sp. UNC438CL73TsuS30 TaxID=1340434 RepID=UPI00047B5B7E|nr:type II secretion system protein [Bacillus sp. UNC438CL73TsuS30]
MKDEKGVTLVEVLATLVILGIISLLIFVVFLGVNKNYQKISKKTDLEQQANLIVSTIKSYHLHQVSYTIKCDSSSGYYLIGTPSANNQLVKKNLVNKFLINNIPISSELTDSNSILIDLSTTKNVSVYIELKNEQGDTFKIDTRIKKY